MNIKRSPQLKIVSSFFKNRDMLCNIGLEEKWHEDDHDLTYRCTPPERYIWELVHNKILYEEHTPNEYSTIGFDISYHVNGEFGREAINCIIEGKRFPKHLKEI